jgi:hypothetical protein
MQDADFIRLDNPVDQVRIFAGLQNAGASFARKASRPWELSDQIQGSFD